MKQYFVYRKVCPCVPKSETIGQPPLLPRPSATLSESVQLFQRFAGQGEEDLATIVEHWTDGEVEDIEHDC